MSQERKMNLLAGVMALPITANGCEHEQCGFGANQLSLTTNLVGTTHFHNQKTSIAYACCYALAFGNLSSCIYEEVILDLKFLNSFPNNILCFALTNTNK